ncbi:MAG: hypothetical protein ACO25B_00660 [Chitinophagaceae bacterium]
MGQSKKPDNKSRRQFFSALFAGEAVTGSSDKVKMLTPDGQLVEVERSVFEQATQRKKASNQDIYNWMENPSKKDS